MSLPARLPGLGLRLRLGGVFLFGLLGVRLRLRPSGSEDSSVALLLLLEVSVSLGILSVVLSLDRLLVESLLGLGLLDGLLVLPRTLNLTEFGVSLPEGPLLAPAAPDPEPEGPGFPTLPALPAPTLLRPLPLPLPLPLPRPTGPPSTCSMNAFHPAVGRTIPTPASGTLAPLNPLPIWRPLGPKLGPLRWLINTDPAGSPNLGWKKAGL